MSYHIEYSKPDKRTVKWNNIIIKTLTFTGYTNFRVESISINDTLTNYYETVRFGTYNPIPYISRDAAVSAAVSAANKKKCP